MRRAAVSIPANITEGATRKGREDYLRFLNIALGSFRELEYYCHLTNALGFLSSADHASLRRKIDEVGRTLFGLTRSVEEDQSFVSTP